MSSPIERLGNSGRVLLKCFAGCPVEMIVKAVGLEIERHLHLTPLRSRQRGMV